MKSDRIYPVLVIVLLLLLIGSGVLAYVFYHMLAHPPSAGEEAARMETAGGSHAAGAGAMPGMAAYLGGGEHAAPGTDGSAAKWAVRAPSSQPAGVGPNLSNWRPERAQPYAPAYLGMPLEFDESCDQYGGEYSMLAAGADVNAILAPGTVCLDVQRPEVFVPQDYTNTYTVGGTTYNACNLDRNVRMCYSLGNVQPDGHGRTWNPMYAPTPRYAHDATNVLEAWHAPFVDRNEASEETQRQRAEEHEAAAIDESAASAPDRNSYFISNDPRAWFTDLPLTARATYIDIRPGVDLSCYADQNRLEYVYVFWPGSDPRDIDFTFDDALGVHEVSHDNIAIDYECATLYEHRPFAYKLVNGEPYETPTTYSIHGKSVSLDIHENDEPPKPAPENAAGGGPTLLQPIVDYLSYLGGKGDDRGYAVTVDNQGYAYVAGATTSSDFASGQAKGKSSKDDTDVFVTKIRISDRKVIYATFLGGRYDDRAFGLAVDPAGNLYVCGETLSPDFATITPPPGGVLGRAWDAFVVKLDPAGQISDFAFRLGGRGDDRAYGIALDAATNIVVVGTTHSDDFPVTDGSAGGGDAKTADAFVVKLSPNGKNLIYAARFGGSGDDQGYALALDHDGSAVIAGETSSKDLPTTTEAFQPRPGGGTWDGFVARFSPDGRRLSLATYLGGKGDDRILGLDVDRARTIYVTGETASEDFPTQRAAQNHFAGGQWDAFCSRLDPAGHALLFSTYLGGSGDDRGFAIAAETSGRLHIAGTTSSTNLPVVRPLQANFGGGKWDAFLAGFGDQGNDVRYLTYLGGKGDDAIYSLAVEAGHILHLAGSTASADLKVVDPLQSSQHGNVDALVGRLVDSPPPPPPLCMVPMGGMPDSPAYDFYMSQFEIDNEQYATFLNDAQANPGSAAGTNVYFDAEGNAWMSPEMVSERDELFSIHNSRLAYDPTYPAGARFSVTPHATQDGGSYAHHPVVGVSWYGAVKYCNWLTVVTGRGAEHRCYREGTRPVDWAPVTCPETSWAKGQFNSHQRLAWLHFKGYRLPMDNCAMVSSGAPIYFRVSNDEFADFLNDAEANPDSLRGSNVWVQTDGDAIYTPAGGDVTGRLFTIANSLLTYNQNAPAGKRFATVDTPPNVTPPYTARAVANVTWFGAMKYCNWLTLLDGMDPKECSYREGPRAEDWAPTTASREGWRDGEFTERERDAWLQLKGYRLPFISASMISNLPPTMATSETPTNRWPNAFDEVLKAAGWIGGTNADYGYGRDAYDLRDANYLDNGMLARHDTTPVGFYDGSDHEGRFPTRTNDNLYGVFDLSGNAAEWLTDPGIAGSLADRVYFGGSWRFPLPNVTDRFYVHPYFTENFMGFRVVTTALSEEMYVARIPFRLCICGYGVGPGCGRGAGFGGGGTNAPPGVPEPGQGLGGVTNYPVEGNEGVNVRPIPPPVPTTTEHPGGGHEGGGGGGGKPGTTTTTTSTTTTTTGGGSDMDDGGGPSMVTICYHDPNGSGYTESVQVPMVDVPGYLALGWYTMGPCP